MIDLKDNMAETVKEQYPWIESNIIGLCSKGLVDASTTGLNEDHFTSFYYKKIWRMIALLRSNKTLPDLITLSNALDEDDSSIPWISIVGDCISNNIGESSLSAHVARIKSDWVKREVSRIGKEMIAYSEKTINDYITELMSLNSTDKKYIHTFEEMGQDALTSIEKTMAGELKPITTGLSGIDSVMGGLHNSDLIIVAARSAMGKTAFLLNMVAANMERPLLFSTEMSRIQAGYRFFSIYGGVHGHKLRTGEIGNEEFGRMSQAIPKMISSNGIIYDKSGPTMGEIEAVARECYHKNGITAIYLDYLQRIKHENPALPPHQAIGDIAMRLKELARELDIPVVALAQVSRKVEAREDKRPQMGDIKDSGTIEQEADIILTLYRDEVYFDDSPDRGTCEVNFKKNRHGGTGMVRVKWTAPTMTFNDMSEASYN